MSAAAKIAGWCLVLSLTVLPLIAGPAIDLRLIEAVKDRDHQAVRVLLKQHVNVNATQGDGATALAWAVNRNDLEMIELLLHAGAKVNAADDLGATPLSLACDSGNAAIVGMLLEAGANAQAATQTGETALMTCVRGGNIEAVKSLLARHADVNAKANQRGQTALMWAVAERQPEMVRAMLAHGADVHARSKGGFTPLLFAARSGDLDSARALIAAGADVNDTAGGMNTLLVAAASGHEKVAIFLIEKGADPNSADDHGITALHYSLLKGLSTLRNVHLFFDEAKSYFYRPDMLELMKVLLGRGANPNARIERELQGSGPLMGSQGPNYISGVPPLLLAAGGGDVAAMRLLIAAGADPLVVTLGDPKLNTHAGATALMLAAGIGGSNRIRLALTPESEKEFLEAVNFLVDLGLDVNAVDSIGQTPLHYAAYRGSNVIIQCLVDKGARVDAKDKYGQTALSIAQGIVPAGITGGKVPVDIRKSTVELLRKLGGGAKEQRPDVASALPAQ